jgi:hypothetical protein
MIHFDGGTSQKSVPDWGEAALFSPPFGVGAGLTLVLASGICHVLHRTALLSQLVTRRARPDDLIR